MMSPTMLPLYQTATLRTRPAFNITDSSYKIHQYHYSAVNKLFSTNTNASRSEVSAVVVVSGIHGLHSFVSTQENLQRYSLVPRVHSGELFCIV